MADGKTPDDTGGADGTFNFMDIPELIGLCRGVLADGKISVTEAAYILDWMNERPDLQENWLASDLYKLLVKVLGDGQLSEAEQVELTGLLEKVIGDPVTLVLH